MWAVGSRGDYKKSTPVAAHWDGRRLTVMMPFIPSSGTGELDAVVAVSSDDVWAVGIDGWGLGRPVVVHWDGRRWTVARAPIFGSKGALSDIVAFGPSDIWAVGQLNNLDDPALPLLMRWNGGRWRVIDLARVAPSDSALNAIDGTSSRDVWAVGEQDLDMKEPSALLLHWNGRAWTKPALAPDDALDRTANAIDVQSAGDVWVMLNGGPHDNSAADVVVHWRGSARGQVAFNSLNGGLEDIAAVSPTRVWAAGYVYPYSSERSHPMLVHWDGRAWRTHHSALDARNAILNSLSTLSATDIWTVGAKPTTADGILGEGLLARYSC